MCITCTRIFSNQQFKLYKENIGKNNPLMEVNEYMKADEHENPI